MSYEKLEIDRLKNSFVSLETESSIQSIDRFLDVLALPISYYQHEVIDIVRKGDRQRLRETICFNGKNDFKVYKQEIRYTVPKADWELEVVTTTARVPVGQRGRGTLRAIESENSSLVRHFFDCGNQRWCKSEIVQTPDDGYLFTLNSKNKWPAWVFLNTRAELPSTLPLRGARGSTDEDLDGFLEDVLGIHRSHFENIFPCKMILVNQNLIRISDNRLVTENGVEAVRLKFELGLTGGMYAHNARPNVKYVFFDETGQTIGNDTLPLSRELLKEGVKLELLPEFQDTTKKIHDSEVGLYLGNALVDRSTGGYIRSISVNVNLNVIKSN